LIPCNVITCIITLSDASAFSFAGIATHYVPSARLPALKERLAELSEGGYQSVNDAIEEFAAEMPKGYEYSLSKHRSAIDRCFKFDSVEEILDALRREVRRASSTSHHNLTCFFIKGTEWSKSIEQKLLAMSPTSLKVHFTLNVEHLVKR
jgi:3-hydroxyisobutyryl-CoA hydrolase